MSIGAPAANFKFNSMQEIKSHSSVLYNERLAILFYLLDMHSIEANTTYSVNEMMRVRSVLKQIYKNIRTLIRNNPTMRATMNLDTKDDGIYITDVGFGMIDGMIQHCETNGYTTKKLYIIMQELNNLEMVIKDALQYFHYFIRPDFRQKPDIELATEKYKEMADQRTLEELKQIVGKRHKLDFEGLGTKRIDIKQQLNYDEEESEIPFEKFDKKADLDNPEDNVDWEDNV
jgi:hypothetical protein